MKFLVNDSQSNRHKAILAFVNEEQSVIALLMAAIDLEWTIRRVIDGMLASQGQGFKPDKVSGLGAYANAWAIAAASTGGKSLPEVVVEWLELRAAYQARNDIVHGRQGTAGLEFISSRVERILNASKLIAKYGSESGVDPYHRLKKRVLAGPTKTKKPGILKSQSQQ